MNNELKKRLRKIDFGKDLDSILITNIRVWNPNFFYFTNSNINGVFLYDFNSNKSKIFTGEMEYKRAKKSWIKDIVKIEKTDDISKFIKGKVGINKENMSVSNFEKLRKLKKKNKKTKIIDISKQLENARMIKTQYEINCIKRACGISEKIYKKAQSEISKKNTEFELKSILEFYMSKFHAGPAFPTIVACGNNIEIAHHKPGNTKLTYPTKPILIDFGVCYNGYNSDLSRTIGSRYEKLINNIMEEVQSKIKPGVKAKEIDSLSRTLLEKKSKYFITSLGHGIGIEVHERPSVSKESKDVFAENMTFTIEPGLYIKNGIRIENDFLLTKKGLINLTNFC